jgi:hypothetical protein
MYLLNSQTIDCLYYNLISTRQNNINYLEKYKILKQNNLIITENILDKVVEIDTYIIKNLNNNDSDKLTLTLFLINDYYEYFKTLNLLDRLIKYKESLLNKKNVLITPQIIEYLKNMSTYIIIENITFEDSFFLIFKNIEACLFILKNTNSVNDKNHILNCNINTIKNILFNKNIFYNSYYYDIQKKTSTLKIKIIKKFYILLAELYNICNGKKISSSIFNIHSFYISETPNTYKQFEINLINLYKCYDNEINILRDVYDINLNSIIHKFVLPDTSRYFIYLGILQNIIITHKHLLSKIHKNIRINSKKRLNI